VVLRREAEVVAASVGAKEVVEAAAAAGLGAGACAAAGCETAYTEAQALTANCWPAPEYETTVNRTELGDLGLTPAQESAIVAFMKTLSDGYVP
jgi:predicted nicotinamide N-methyase